MNEHAKLSPSGAVRWLKCTGSLSEKHGAALHDPSSPAAAEGTLAHELLAKRLYRKNALRDVKDREMAEHVEWAARLIKAEGPLFSVEKTMWLTLDCWGTPDAVVYDRDTGRLSILDLKYGRSPVQARDNPQLAIYAVAVAQTLGMLGGPVEWPVRSVIIQPRTKPQVRRALVTYDAGMNIMENARRIAAEAEHGAHEFNRGTWCFFCKCKPSCPEHRPETYALLEQVKAK